MVSLPRSFHGARFRTSIEDVRDMTVHVLIDRMLLPGQFEGANTHSHFFVYNHYKACCA